MGSDGGYLQLNCDKFVMPGADLVYWQRRLEQWRMVAEGAPTSVAADYLNDLVDPTARANDGLEGALAAVGLLDEALSSTCGVLRSTSDAFGAPPFGPTNLPAKTLNRTRKRIAAPEAELLERDRR